MRIIKTDSRLNKRTVESVYKYLNIYFSQKTKGERKNGKNTYGNKNN